MSDTASVARLRNEMNAIHALFGAVTGPLVLATLTQERKERVLEMHDEQTVASALLADPAFKALIARTSRFVIACHDAGISIRSSG